MHEQRLMKLCTLIILLALGLTCAGCSFAGTQATGGLPSMTAQAATRVIQAQTTATKAPAVETPDEVEQAIADLKDPDAQARYTAAYNLEMAKDERAVEPLLGVLNDASSEVCVEAIRALIAIGDRRAVEPMIMALESPDMNIRIQAAAGLGKFNDARAIEPLIALLGEEYLIASQAIYSLSLFGSAAIDPLAAAMNNPDPQFRMKAVNTLGKIGGPATIQPLMEALNDQNINVRGAATYALGQFYDTSMIDIYIEAMKNPNPDVRSSMVAFLSQYQDRRATQAITAALNDPDAEVAEEARRRVENTQTPRRWRR